MHSVMAYTRLALTPKAHKNGINKPPRWQPLQHSESGTRGGGGRKISPAGGGISHGKGGHKCRGSKKLAQKLEKKKQWWVARVYVEKNVCNVCLGMVLLRVALAVLSFLGAKHGGHRFTMGYRQPKPRIALGGGRVVVLCEYVVHGHPI